MGKFAENLNLGKRVLPPCVFLNSEMRHQSVAFNPLAT